MGFRRHREQQRQQIVMWAELHVHWIYTHTLSIGQATERPLRFDSPTRTRGNSDLCVDDGYCLQLLSVDKLP